MKSLAFGEILWDIIEGNALIGGAPLNVSAHLSKMGAEASIISAIGKDEYGVKALEATEMLKVNKAFIQTSNDYPTGTVDVFLTNGQPDYTIHEEVAWDSIQLNESLINSLSVNEWDVFIFGSLAQRSENNQTALDEIFSLGKFKHVFFDVNLRKQYFSREILSKSLEKCSILKLNDEEVKIIRDEFIGEQIPDEVFCHRLSEKFSIESIIITLGAEGAHLYHKGVNFKVDGKPATVKDTIGAGDSFSAAFLYTFLKTGDPLQAVENGCTLGAYVASSNGAIPNYNPQELLNI